MTDIMNKLNNIFPDDDSISAVITYLKTNQIPDNVNKKRFITKYKHFVLRDGHLVYQPLNLAVVKKSDIMKTLETLYKTDPNAFGKGIVTLYKYVTTKYINITRADVNTFLKDQLNYQMTRTISKRINKSIIAAYPNQLWCIDLIDLNLYVGHNYQFRYIIDVVNAFSRKVWLEKLRKKQLLSPLESLRKFVTEQGCIRLTY